jgi:hypothetical protein
MAYGRVRCTLDALVSALCLDYARRREAIEKKSVGRRCETEYKYYNYFIFDAAAEIVGERLAERYISDIGEHIGYAKTEIDCVSEVTYKNYKRMIMDNIARKLHLRD